MIGRVRHSNSFVLTRLLRGLTSDVAGEGPMLIYDPSESHRFPTKRNSQWEWRARMSAPPQALADQIAERRAQRRLETRQKSREQMSQQREDSLTTKFTNFLLRKDYEQHLKEQLEEWARQAAMVALDEEAEAEAEPEEQNEATQIPEEFLQALDDDQSTPFMIFAPSQQSPSQSTDTLQKEEEFLVDESEDEEFEELCRRMENI